MRHPASTPGEWPVQRRHRAIWTGRRNKRRNNDDPDPRSACWERGAGKARRMIRRRTIAGTNNPSVVGCAKARNNGRYNGNGREWETPPEIFDPLNKEFSFTLDPCATEKSAKCERFFTEAENGLGLPWAPARVFMNPPYGKEIYAWTAKALEESKRGALVVGLLPASTDLEWWHRDIVRGGAEIRFLRGRVRFLTNGPYRASGFFPSVVVVWRPTNPRLVPGQR